MPEGLRPYPTNPLAGIFGGLATGLSAYAEGRRLRSQIEEERAQREFQRQQRAYELQSLAFGQTLQPGTLQLQKGQVEAQTGELQKARDLRQLEQSTFGPGSPKEIATETTGQILAGQGGGGKIGTPDEIYGRIVNRRLDNPATIYGLEHRIPLLSRDKERQIALTKGEQTPSANAELAATVNREEIAGRAQTALANLLLEATRFEQSKSESDRTFGLHVRTEAIKVLQDEKLAAPAADKIIKDLFSQVQVHKAEQANVSPGTSPKDGGDVTAVAPTTTDTYLGALKDTEPARAQAQTEATMKIDLLQTEIDRNLQLIEGTNPDLLEKIRESKEYIAVFRQPQLAQQMAININNLRASFLREAAHIAPIPGKEREFGAAVDRIDQMFQSFGAGVPSPGGTGGLPPALPGTNLPVQTPFPNGPPPHAGNIPGGTPGQAIKNLRGTVKPTTQGPVTPARHHAYYIELQTKMKQGRTLSQQQQQDYISEKAINATANAQAKQDTIERKPPKQGNEALKKIIDQNLKALGLPSAAPAQ